MKVLFVCQANIGRSQVAQACFDQLSSHESAGAGMAVDEITAKGNWPSKKLKDVPNQRSVEYIKREFGVDISDRERRQLTPQMMDEADIVVIINDKANWPTMLRREARWSFGTSRTQRDRRTRLFRWE